MSKVVSREKDTRSSSTATSSSRAKPSSSSLQQNNNSNSQHQRSESKPASSLVVSKPGAESSATVAKSSGVSDMRAHEWKNFFLDSGIPEHAATEYATIFLKERINFQILKNLDKGYLTDMGIHCVGDQIAILQAAKKYCGEQYTPGQTKSLVGVASHQRMEGEESHQNKNNNFNKNNFNNSDSNGNSNGNGSGNGNGNGSGSGSGLSARNPPLTSRVVEAPERVTVLSTVSRLSPKKTMRNEVTSTTAIRSVVQNSGESMVLLRGKRSVDEDEQERMVMKKISAQPDRQVRQLPSNDTSFTVRLGSAGGVVKRGDVFSRLSQKSNNNNNLVRVLETRMSHLSTGPSSNMPANAPPKATLVSDRMEAATPIHNRLGSTNTTRNALRDTTRDTARNALRDTTRDTTRDMARDTARDVTRVRAAGSTVFSRLGYQAKTPNFGAPSGDLRNKLSVHDRLGTRR